MGFRFAAARCCCCLLMYKGNPLRGVNFAKFVAVDDGGSNRYQRIPEPAAVSASSWALDHYSRKIFTITNTQIRWVDAKIPDDSDDLVYNDVLALGGSQIGERVDVASEDAKVYYVVRDSPATTSRYVRECDFDGANDQAVATITLNSSLTPIQWLKHCRSNDKLYYVCQTSGDARTVIRRMDRDGANDELVYDPGAGNAILSGPRYTLDNERHLLYAIVRFGSSTYRIIRMLNDGTSPTTYYEAPVQTPVQQIHGICWSHLHDRMFWLLSNNQTETGDNANDPDGGVYSAKVDGIDVQRHYKRYQSGLGDTTGSLFTSHWDLGCGFETMGAATKA